MLLSFFWKCLGWFWLVRMKGDDVDVQEISWNTPLESGRGKVLGRAVGVVCESRIQHHPFSHLYVTRHSPEQLVSKRDASKWIVCFVISFPCRLLSLPNQYIDRQRRKLYGMIITQPAKWPSRLPTPPSRLLRKAGHTTTVNIQHPINHPTESYPISTLAPASKQLSSLASPTLSNQPNNPSRNLFRLPASTALDAARHGAVDVVVGDPALVVALGALAAARDAGRLGAGQGLGLDDDLARGLLAACGSLGGAGLREEGLDPGLVDEVEGCAEDAGED